MDASSSRPGHNTAAPPRMKVLRQGARRGETRLLVVGAVLVLGAAVAIGVSSRGGGSG